MSEMHLTFFSRFIRIWNQVTYLDYEFHVWKRFSGRNGLAILSFFIPIIGKQSAPSKTNFSTGQSILMFLFDFSHSFITSKGIPVTSAML